MSDTRKNCDFLTHLFNFQLVTKLITMLKITVTHPLVKLQMQISPPQSSLGSYTMRKNWQTKIAAMFDACTKLGFPR